MTQTLAPQAPAQTMSVRYEGGERYEITVRDHTIVADQPADAGGSDSAPTPTELFVASLAGCVAFYAGRYLTRHGLLPARVSACSHFRMAPDRRARVADIHLTVRPPRGFPAERAGPAGGGGALHRPQQPDHPATRHHRHRRMTWVEDRQRCGASGRGRSRLE